MALFCKGQFVEDIWQMLPDEALALPETGQVIIPIARWPEMRDVAISHVHISVGLALAPEINVLTLAEDIKSLGTRLKLITIPFAKFADGRGFSQSMLLRSRLHYQNELRAVGDVLWDELTFLQRCGFDAFDIHDAQTLAELAKAHNVGTPLNQHLFYQPGVMSGETKIHGRPWLRAIKG